MKNYLLSIILFAVSISFSANAQMTGGGQESTTPAATQVAKKAKPKFGAVYIGLASPTGDFKEYGYSSGVTLGVMGYKELAELADKTTIGITTAFNYQVNSYSYVDDFYETDAALLIMAFQIGVGVDYKLDDKTRFGSYIRVGPGLGIDAEAEETAWGIPVSIGAHMKWSHLYSFLEIAPGKLKNSETDEKFDIGTFKLGIGFAW